MDTTLSPVRKYRHPYRRETGEPTRYNIQKLRTLPGKLTTWYKKRIEETKEQQGTGASDEIAHSQQ